MSISAHDDSSVDFESSSSMEYLVSFQLSYHLSEAKTRVNDKKGYYNPSGNFDNPGQTRFLHSAFELF